MSAFFQRLVFFPGTLGLLILLLTACSSPQSSKPAVQTPESEQLAKSVQSWVGLPKAELLEMVGPPSVSELIDGQTLHTYYFLDGHFVSPDEAAGIDANEDDSFECRFRVRYRDGRVESATADGRACVTAP